MKMLGVLAIVLPLGLSSAKNVNVFSRLFDDLIDDHGYQGRGEISFYQLFLMCAILDHNIGV